jgi:hypothetical protein
MGPLDRDTAQALPYEACGLDCAWHRAHVHDVDRILRESLRRSSSLLPTHEREPAVSWLTLDAVELTVSN